MKKKYLYFILFFVNFNIFSQVTTVSTIAGTGESGYLDGSVNDAKFSYPGAVAVDVNGIVYVADTGNDRIRKIDSNGIVTTLSGDGTNGFLDGGPTIAKFASITDIAIDASGNLYVTDFGNNRIRKITPSGFVSTVAGSGVSGFSDGNNLDAAFRNPAGLTIDGSGDIYVADQNNKRIRKISGGQTTTIAGDGTDGYLDGNALSSKFSFPTDLEFIGQDLYIVDNWNNKIRKIASGQVTTLTGNGYGFLDGSLGVAKFSNPLNIAVNSNGDIFISDTVNNRIRKISGNQVSTYAGSGASGSGDGNPSTATFTNPNGIAIDSNGNLYIADGPNHKIRKISTSGILDVKEFEKENEIELYPNPVEDNLTLKSSQNEFLMLLDNTGKKIGDVKLNANENKNIDFSNLSNGVYYLTDGKQKSAKIIKE